jgi:hypothetical protein
MSEQLTYTIIARRERVEDSWHYLTIAEATRLKKKLEAEGYTVNLIREDTITGTRRSNLG